MLRTVEELEDQQWLEPASKGIQRVVRASLPHDRPLGRWLDDALNGVWLGHPLHPVLVDVPIGAWTVTAVLDATEAVSGERRFATGADVSLALGLAGAVGAALAGLAQWQYTSGRARRKGLLHALLNTGATTLYATSLLCRLARARGMGRATAFVGYALVTVSSYIGGDLVFAERIGVSHAPEQRLPDEYVRVLAAADLAEGAPTRVEVRGVPVLLLRRGERIFALAETCAHLGGPLAQGTVEGNTVICPWHGSQFSVEDGHVVHGPATTPQPCYQARIHDGQIEVRQPRPV